METTPTVENVVTRFDAHTAAHRLDVVDRRVASIVDTRTVEGSIVRIYNAAGFEFMTLKSDIASTQFDSLFGGKPVGARHAEDGRLYAILKDGDCTREEPVGVFPFADVQVGPNCEFGRRVSAVAVEYGPAAVTATRPHPESEADFPL